MDAEPEFRIVCDGGCGRVMVTSRPTVLWTVTTCPECLAARPNSD